MKFTICLLLIFPFYAFAFGTSEDNQSLPDRIETFLFSEAFERKYVEGTLPLLEKVFHVGIQKVYEIDNRVVGYEFIDTGSVWAGFGWINYEDGKIVGHDLFLPLEYTYQDLNTNDRFDPTSHIEMYQFQNLKIIVLPWYKKLFVFDEGNNLFEVDALIGVFK